MHKVKYLLICMVLQIKSNWINIIKVNKEYLWSLLSILFMYFFVVCFSIHLYLSKYKIIAKSPSSWVRLTRKLSSPYSIVNMAVNLTELSLPQLEGLKTQLDQVIWAINITILYFRSLNFNKRCYFSVSGLQTCSQRLSCLCACCWLCWE